MTCPRCGQRLLRDGSCLTHGEPSAPPISAPIEKRPERARWAEEDKARAIALASDPSLTGPQLAALLGRSHKGLKHVLARLGVSKARGKPAPRRARQRPVTKARQWWSEAEVAALHDGELKIVGTSRSRASIALKRHREGITNHSEGWVTISEVCRQYKAPRRRIQRMVESGVLPANRVNSRLVLIDPADVERLMPQLKAPKKTWRGQRR